ncbi:MAG: 2-C-methyl-D-erythritol 2,4-cyclodiphosphate synthase [Eubacteriales bacterium]|nr:2-C-methyl-D-erythritol 2,4-cyclodiphosphate synthase [Eubacteriales bacterium]
MRIGFGYDVHAFKEGRKLIIGGVEIPYRMGLDGHSDADVLTHAVMDAILGSLALGDIGQHFPDNDDSYLNIDSFILLGRVREMMEEHGYRLVNLDSVVVAQEPRLSGYIPEMRERYARALNVDMSRISVKATTEERMGFTGSLGGIKAYCTCLIDNADSEH